MRDALRLMAPDPAGAVWLGLIVAFALFGDFRRLTTRRNAAVAGLLILSPLWARAFGFNDVLQSTVAGLLFTGIYLTTAAYAIWGGVLALRRPGASWEPNPNRTALQALVAVLLILNAIVVFGRPPDDAGYYTNLGARRWVETGTLPYGDDKLKGPTAPGFGASATYGPVLYTAHIPFQLLLRVPSNAPDMDPMDKAYQRPPIVTTQAACFAFYLIGLASLYAIVRRLGSPNLGLAAVALFAGSPYVLGLGGDREVITGLAFVSHIAPSALMLTALAWTSWPVVSGALLALAAGALFFPAFLFPLWFGWMLGHDMRRAVRFTLGFAVTGIIILAVVVWFTHAPEGSSTLSLFLESTLEHQEGVGPKAYGASQFGFWGTHPRLAAFWQTPVFGTTSLFKPTFLLFAMLAVAAFFIASSRPRTVPQLAGLTAMLAAAVQLWKTHAAGSYVEWYYPFLIIALILGSAPRLEPRTAEPR